MASAWSKIAKAQSLQQPHDPNVIELVSLFLQLKDAILAKRGEIQTHFVELFVTYYGPALERLADDLMTKNKNWGDGLTAVLLAVVDDVNSASPSSDYTVMRYIDIFSLIVFRL
jgi:hypothetical protein